ncbi:MAG TPA: prepilin-type N-terminal cleavage/methylation domain-containing protein [Candidatus Saccharimonadales bacterium]|nr:prepilin-type N-terminal cleavage/methylation domain-containing protein [Candidatus Saccharimonadales bacterium]
MAKRLYCIANRRREYSDADVASSGFTLPELISVMVISLLFSGLITMFAFEYWRASASLTTNMETFVGRLNAGDRLREALNASSGLIIQNSIPDFHTGDPDTTVPGGQYWKPLHAVPGTTSIGASGTFKPLLYFKSPSRNTSKNIVLNGAQPYEDEFVLYIDGSTKELRMRMLANSSAPSNRIKTTCPPASATSSCPADRLIATNVASVKTRYFSRSANLIDYTSIVDSLTGAYIGPDYPAVEVVELTLNVFKKSQLKGGADTINQTVVRIALRNS